jgi:hypothetical protein
MSAEMPTPHNLKAGSRWSFVLLNGEGQITATFVAQLSDVAAMETCENGNYRRLEIVSERRSGNSVPLRDPAYEVTGAALRIQLSTGLCDDGYAIIGRVTEAGFEGIHMPEVLIAPKGTHDVVQRAYGVPLPLMPNTSLERTRER